MDEMEARFKKQGRCQKAPRRDDNLEQDDSVLYDAKGLQIPTASRLVDSGFNHDAVSCQSACNLSASDTAAGIVEESPLGYSIDCETLELFPIT